MCNLIILLVEDQMLLRKRALLIVCIMIIAGCSVEPLEVMKVAHLTSITEIKEQKHIKRIDQLLTPLQWQDKQLPTNSDPDYSFWLERKGVENRVKNYELWVNDHQSVIIDHVQVKYAFINGDSLRELVHLLK